LGELVDFELEVFNVSEAVSHTIEPADFVVEALHTGIAKMFEGPVAGDAKIGGKEDYHDRWVGGRLRNTQ